jgi:flagella basal body P-ring formation protein FlgA
MPVATIMTVMARVPALSAALLILAALGALAAMPRTALGATTSLNEHVVVHDGVIRLGDLFDGLDGGPDGQGSQAVAQAPAPGERTVYDITRLAAVARAHAVDWRPRTWTDRLVVERASQRVGQEAIEAALRAELKRRGLSRKNEVELAGRGLEMVLPTGVAPTIAVQQFDYDERGGRFVAVIAAPAESPTSRMTVQGRIHETVEVPVLARRMNAGEVIQKDDLEWTGMRADQVNRNILTDSGRLVGQEVRRGTPAGHPVRAADIRSPIVVSKNSMVTMVLQTPRMQLTSKGRAMEDASMGDAVRIMNVQSKAVVEATVIGANTVQVSPAAAMPY